MAFSVGSEVVVQGCGVGRVAAIETVALGEEEAEMYKIEFEGTSFRTWIPLERIEGVARPVMSSDDADAMLEVIGTTEAPKKRANWRRRHARYMKMLMANEPIELAALLGELAAVRQEKVLSFQERKLFERVKTLMVRELAVAKGVEADAMEAQLAPVFQAAA